MLKLGNIHLDVPFYQAPLSGYSDRAMRILARRFGCPLTFAGVILAKTACYPHIYKSLHFKLLDDDRPIGAQLLGTDPETIATGAKNLTDFGYDIIDINFACPAPKVLRRGRGGALLNDPDKAIEMFRRVRDAISVPLLIKIRIGYDKSAESRDNFWRICETAAAEGIDALTVHGRTVAQYFRGKADWNILRELKQRLPDTLIFGSGDLFTAEDVVNRLTETGIDGVTIARGAIGNPWIFAQTCDVLEGRSPKFPDLTEISAIMTEHFDMVCQLYKPKKAVGYFRKFAAKYSRTHPERKKVNLALMAAKTPQEVSTVIKTWFPIPG